MSFFSFFFFSAPKPKFWLRFINFESCRLPSLHLEKKFITSCRDFCKHVDIILGPFSFKEAVIILLMSVAEKLSMDAEASAATCFVFSCILLSPNVIWHTRIMNTKCWLNK